MIDVDTHFMRHALSLAKRNLGQTWPNPAVGALVVKSNIVLGAGWTARGGRPHAEPQALAQAGAEAHDATLYVTLEPCAHHGKTPPCTDAIIASGISRVVIACTDPEPNVNGKGAARLREAGIAITERICEAEALALNAGFFSVVRRSRPYVALKIATSLDGKIAMQSGESQWITGETARLYAHRLRSEHDAILTGIGTVLADDPALTCRLPGLLDRSPMRVVMDRQDRLPKESRLAPTWAFAEPLGATLRELATRGITRVLVEAGSTLTTAFLKENLVDRLYWFRSPMLLGAEEKPAVGALQMETLAACPRYRLVEAITLGNDIVEVLECSPAS